MGERAGVLHGEADRLADRGREWEGLDQFVANRYYAAAAQLRKAAQVISAEERADATAPR